MGATMGLKGSDHIGLRAFLADLTYDEVHAFVMGFYEGFTDFRRWDGVSKETDAIDEPGDWYEGSGYVAGALVRVGVVLALTLVAGSSLV